MLALPETEAAIVSEAAVFRGRSEPCQTEVPICAPASLGYTTNELIR